ncbi:hypothetical protein D3C86_1902670 [compost metagenome]
MIAHLVKRRAPLLNRFGSDGRQRAAHPDAVQIALVVAQRARGDGAQRRTAGRIEMRKVGGDEGAQGGDASLVLFGQRRTAGAGIAGAGICQLDEIEFELVDAKLIFQVKNRYLIMF